MAFRLLLDEMTERRLAELLATREHDVERSVRVDELGRGTDDATIVAYAARAERLLVTYDDDFLDPSVLGRIGVLVQPNERTSSFRTANMIDGVATAMAQEQVVDHDDAVYLGERWL